MWKATPMSPVEIWRLWRLHCTNMVLQQSASTQLTAPLASTVMACIMNQNAVSYSFVYLLCAVMWTVMQRLFIGYSWCRKMYFLSLCAADAVDNVCVVFAVAISNTPHPPFLWCRERTRWLGPCCSGSRLWGPGWTALLAGEELLVHLLG